MVSPAFKAPVTSAFAGASFAFYGLLQLRVGLYRKTNKILYGVDKNGKEDEKLVHLRAAGSNYGEYQMPLLFLLYLMESQKLLSTSAICTFGTAFLASRFLHATVLYSGNDIPYGQSHLRPLAFLTTVGLLVGGGAWMFYHAYTK